MTENPNFIRLSKTLEEPTDGRSYVANLESVVMDLSSTPFDRKVQLYHGEDHHASYYDINYGANMVRDRSGAPQEKHIWGFDVDIDTLRQLRRHLRKAKRTENPDFTIGYKNLEFVKAKTSLDQLFGPCTISVYHGNQHRVRRIEINEENSSTYVTAKLGKGGSIEIEIKYSPLSYPREQRRIDRAVAKLKDRGYSNVTYEVKLSN